MTVRILHGDCREVLASLPDASVQCCVTSPPYYRLRDAGNAQQIGMESSSEDYLAQIVVVFRHIWRSLKDDGVIFLNLGDSYENGHRQSQPEPRLLYRKMAGYCGTKSCGTSHAQRPHP